MTLGNTLPTSWRMKTHSTLIHTLPFQKSPPNTAPRLGGRGACLSQLCLPLQCHLYSADCPESQVFGFTSPGDLTPYILM